MYFDPYSLVNETRLSILVSKLARFIELLFCRLMHKSVVIINPSVKYSYGRAVHANWGDDLNVYFLAKVAKEHFISLTSYARGKGFSSIRDYSVHYLIGSCFHMISESNAIVWGSGLLAEDHLPKVNSLQIFAVRGPKTRAVLQSNGIQCPEVYGDPALLLPFYYKPTRGLKRYKIGVIPHYVDTDKECLAAFAGDDEITIINITGYDKWTSVIDAVCGCDFIFSSSLHGLILSEAYGIPCRWTEFQEPLVGEEKRRFKFYDFYQSIGCFEVEPFRIDMDTTKDDVLIESRKLYTKKVISVLPLVKACPFTLKRPRIPFK